METERMIDMGIEPFKSCRKQANTITGLISLHIADLQEAGNPLPRSKPPILARFGKWELGCHACNQ